MIEFAGDDDFRSIGLRPMEYRPAIIRRAMTRSALPLVQMHLQRPDVGVERRLSHIITLGYHLLDPRRRADSLQRMMLGRVHPQLSDEAVRIAQAKGSPLMLADDNDDVDTVLARGRGLLNVSPLIGATKDKAAHQVSHAHFSSAVGTAWDVALQSHDLSLDRPTNQWWWRSAQLSRRIAGQPRRMVAAGSVALAAMLWLAWPSSSAPDAGAVPTAVAAPNLATPDLATSSATERGAAELLKPLPAVAPSKSANGVTPVVAASVTLNPQATGSVNAGMTDALPVKAAGESAKFPQPVVKPVPTDSTINVPSLSPATPEPSLDEALGAWDSLATDVSKTASAVATFFPPLDLVSDADAAATMPSVSVAVDGMPAISEVAPTGVPWQEAIDIKSLRASVASQVLSQKFADADSAIVNVATTHSAIATMVAAELMHEDSGPLPFAEQSKARISYLTLWTGRSFLAGDLASAKLLLVSAHATAKQAESDELLVEVRDWQKSLETILRLSETTDHADADALTPVQKYSVGRYWALVRRDWTKGLPYLCSSSDPLVSKLAVQETLLGPDTTAADLIAIADSYLTLAEKNKSWLHDSYVLHADELLVHPNDKLSTSDKLQLTRYQADLAKRFGDVFNRADDLQIKSAN